MIIATAGHVDHGKTSLVKALTGVDADRLPEEKRRGMTIDLGFAYLPGKHATEGAAEDAPGDATTLGFVDVPGHERFIHNMLAGVAGIDCALLVIAADDGPMPQTREHVAILDLLGTRTGAVALTKIDAVEPERVAVVTREIAALLSGTSLAASPVFPLSSLNGIGVPALLTHLQSFKRARTQATQGRFRMTVDRSFSVAGAGLVVTGTIIAGEIAVGDEVQVLLAGAHARVRGLHAQSRAAGRARAGERCAINLAGSGLNHTDIARGDWIVATSAGETMAAAVQRIDMRLRVLSSESRPLKHWTPVHAHIGAANVTGRIALLESDSITPGENGLAQLVLDSAAGACHGDIVILRDQSARRTIGGGKVIDIHAPPRGRARPARLAFLQAMEPDDAVKAMRATLEVSPCGLNIAQFAACRNLTAAQINQLAVEVVVEGAADGASKGAASGSAARDTGSTLRRINAGSSHDTAFLPAHWNAARAAALATVAAWHKRTPNSPGIPEDRLLEGARLPLSSATRSALANDLVATGQLMRAGAALRLPSHESGLRGPDQTVWERAQVALATAAARPPTVAELATTLKEQPRRVKEVLARAAQLQLCWRIADERFALPAVVHVWAGHASALAGAERKERFTAAQFRDASGAGRNLSIEILEFFDRMKFTRRLGDARLLQCASDAIFGSAGA